MGRHHQLSPLFIGAALFSGCQIDDLIIIHDAGIAQSTTDAGFMDAGPTRRRIDSTEDVFQFLEGTRLVMTAPDVPSHPMGYDEHINYGQATQCLNTVVMETENRNITVTTKAATLNGAPNPEDRGQCDRTSPSGSEFIFTTTTVAIEDVRDNGACFDITLTYAGFGQEGRGSISADGETVLLELFFRDQALKHRCAAGAVGAATVSLNQELFGGNAVQTYRFE